MIPDVCTWAYDLAVSWLPPLSFLWGDSSEESAPEAPVSRSAEEGATPGPATAEALARAREALQQIDRDAGMEAPSRRLDARFRSSPAASILGAGAGIHRLVGRLEELDVDQLPSEEREALMGAASGLVARLRESMV